MPKNRSRILKIMSVEPALCLYTMVFVMIDSTITNLLLQKKCRFNCTSEPDLNTPCDDEKQGILFVSEVNSIYRLSMYLLCSIYVVLAAGWSDIAGRRRRPLILFPIIGLICQSVMGCLHTYFWSWPPFTAALSNLIFDVISGGIPVINVASITYMCDVTDVKSRTMKLGLLSAARTFGDLVGFGSSGFVLRSVGFFYSFFLCLMLSSMALVLALFLVEDISIPVDKKPHICQFFNLMRIKDATEVVYKKSLGRNRIVVTMLFVISTSVFITTQGENGVQYLFLRYKFHWDERDYSFYVIYRYIGVIIGNVFCSVILSNILGVHDGLIGVFAGTWDTIAAFGYLFASQNWHLYIIPIFDIFHGTAYTASSAFLSKYYNSDEFGRLQSFLTLFGLLIPACHPIYSEIFRRTLEVFPSSYFIFSIALDVIVVLLYCLSYSLSKKFQTKKAVGQEEMPMMM
ncbi:probable peptidoglycan muropeptide transporter SLC46 [Planococcus citri]|uniref:probable peptidoglycan muropeptide transporter SLC46 n=1 Tax=Planococcus citri TaxID=170843 RepID=UPI0031F83A70